MPTLTASAQYDDFRGTAAADWADQANLQQMIESRGLMKSDEMVVALEVYWGENHGGRVASPFIHAFIAPRPNADAAVEWIASTPDPLPLRQVRLEFSTDEFLGLFKRVSVVLTRRGFGLDGRDVQSN